MSGNYGTRQYDFDAGYNIAIQEAADLVEGSPGLTLSGDGGPSLKDIAVGILELKKEVIK